jgi:uncharacterized protein DUF4238
MGHHYVPQFLLRRWATEGRLIAYFFETNSNKVVENPKATVASACQIKDLNVFFGVDLSQRDFPETRFFTPRVDTPAATALKILETDVSKLTQERRMDWARLIVSFGVRTPEALRDMGPKEAKKAFEVVQAMAKGDPQAERRVTALIEKNMRTFQQNFPLQTAIELSTDPQKLATVGGMDWWITRWPRPAILIGDRPLLTYPRMKYPCGIPLNNPSCLIALPIAPNAVFFASADRRTKSKEIDLDKMARAVNEETIFRSTTCIYASDKSLASFVKPRIAGKATGTWQPGSS